MIKEKYNSGEEKVIIVIYIRKSKKLEYGLTFETQLYRCEEDAKKNFGEDVRIVVFSEDNKSGDDSSRKEYNKMKDFIKENKNCILYSYAVSRLVRDVIEGKNLAKLLTEEKCQLFICDVGRIHVETPEGRSFFIAQCNNAEVQLNTTKQNQGENLFTKSRSSIKTGSQAPYGYKNESREIYVNGHLKKEVYYSIVESEIYQVCRIYELYLKYQSISKVTEILQKENVRGKYGSLICKGTVGSVLRNAVNVKVDQKIVDYFEKLEFTIGKVEFGKGGNTYGKKINTEFLSDDYRKKYFFTLVHDGVIDSDKWLEVQRILDRRSKLPPKKGKSKKSALDNLLKCRCGAEMKIVTIKEEKVYYGCSKKCGNKNINGTNLEKYIFDDILEIDKNVLTKYMENNYKKIITKLNVKYNELNKEGSYLRRKNNRLVENISNLERNMLARTMSINDAINKNHDRLLMIEEKINIFKERIPSIENKVKDYIVSVRYSTLNDVFFKEQYLEVRKSILRMTFQELVWDSSNKTVYIKKNLES